jgi:hypothetical protein
MRDWRSGIVTITVRDSRMRQHDPILGVVPLKLSDILQTSSQVTRWYPLDGGIGFGRVRISLLFRSVETRLPPSQLGWDVGTFEFTSDKILATGYHTNSKLKMRTGGSSGKIRRNHCKATDEKDGIYWDLSPTKGHDNNVRLPVKYRYRSPVVFEFHTARHRSADAYAIVWLHHLEDNKEENISIPIWKTDKGMRLTQNYITEENFKEIPDLQVEEVGRLQFRGRFKAGTDADHAHYISDNDSRETHETWEACNAEGVREQIVTKELPPAVQALHDQSLTQGRDVLSQADESDKKKWLSKDGTDWSGAFGQDPAQYTDKKGTRSTGGEIGGNNLDSAADDYDSDDSSSSSDLGIQDGDNDDNTNTGKDAAVAEGSGCTHEKNPVKQAKTYNEEKSGLHRKHRGLMQWKPMRNLQFAKNETKYAIRRTLHKGDLAGRQPDVETET